MPSGVIFAVIVALWAVLLVPALLRRHDHATESRSIDRFANAMRILSRRTPEVPGQRYVVMPQRPAWASGPVVSSGKEPAARRTPAGLSHPEADARVQEPVGTPPPPAVCDGSRLRSAAAAARTVVRTTAGVVARTTARTVASLLRLVVRSLATLAGSAARAFRSLRGGSAAPRGRASLAVRRRRLLLALVTVAVVPLIGAVVAGGLWWGASACSAVLLLADLVHLRGEARRHAVLTRRRRAAAAGHAAPGAPAASSAHAGRAASAATRGVGSYAGHAAYRRSTVADQPLPTGDSVAGYVAPGDAVDTDVDPAVGNTAAATDPDSWAPVPVTLPTYVTKPVVSRPPTPDPAPGDWISGLGEDEDAAAEDVDLGGGDLDAIIERRRAVGD